MPMDQIEFEFPDEKEAKENARKGGAMVDVEDKIEVVEDDKPEIEVVDDTPEKDRGREPMKTPPPADLTEDDLRTVILPTGWVDVKVCAIDEDWSGLKFLKRKANPSEPLG